MKRCSQVRCAFLCVSTFLALVCPLAIAQAESPQFSGLSGIWGTVGGGSGSHNWPGAYLSLTAANHNGMFYSLRIAGVVEDDEKVSPNESVTDLALLIGSRYHPIPQLILSAAAGPSFVSVVRRGNVLTQDEVSGKRRFSEVAEGAAGLAFEGQAILPIFRVVGVGFGVFGNLNPKSSYIGGSFNLSLGYIH